ncbi:ABC-2 type transport system permease protein [Prosthecobacter debontii]|uniref:ABC-2 type transport system permease protein n=1 Tax=Prosthecobacter debontii TaxID=48467 RepID=A0A1T4YJN9_9BACT|nr:ABC transporter permease [Prosthecobacter debontii]SKB02067.1 ABC-2 type transport system permease protein [Prosthecobacter debontii]
MNLRVIWALVLRYIFLYTRNPVRLVEMVFWPVVDLLVWGNLTLFLQRNSSHQFGNDILFLLGAMILWDIMFRAQQGVAISFLEDVWTRNLLNVFVAPVRTSEYLAATFAVGVLRILVTGVVLGSIAWFGYAFNVFVLEWWLVPFFLNLMLFGWALGMISTALILRWGQAAESLAWAVPFFIQPAVAVFYPVADMPTWSQPIAWAFPATYIFEGMREVMWTGTMNLTLLVQAFTLNLVYLAAAGGLFLWILRLTRKRGLLTKFATQ